MDREKFINRFEEEDKNIASKLYEEIELCKKINFQIYGDIFLPPRIWVTLEKTALQLGVEVELKGLNKEAEKRIYMLNPIGEAIYSYDYPMKYFNIEGKNKFFKQEHKHYLAAIMNLGIKRERLGDLIVREGDCYGVIADELFDYLKNHLNKVGKNEIEVVETKAEIIPKSEFIEEQITVSSLRLDAIVAGVTNKSRNIATELIDNGLVTVNYLVKRKKDLTISLSDVITIRKFGKFILNENLGETKKGKTRIVIKKYA